MYKTEYCTWKCISSVCKQCGQIVLSEYIVRVTLSSCVLFLIDAAASCKLNTLKQSPLFFFQITFRLPSWALAHFRGETSYWRKRSTSGWYIGWNKSFVSLAGQVGCWNLVSGRFEPHTGWWKYCTAGRKRPLLCSCTGDSVMAAAVATKTAWKLRE